MRRYHKPEIAGRTNERAIARHRWLLELLIAATALGLYGCREEGVSECQRLNSRFAHVEIPERRSETPYLRGKLAVVETGAKRLYRHVDSDNNLYLALDDRQQDEFVTPGMYLMVPADVRASTPDEVGSIAVMEWSLVESGVYVQSGGKREPAYDIACDVTLIDMVDRVVTLRKTYKKAAPAQSAWANSATKPRPYAEPPIQEIMREISALQKR